jgi:hypothetical protein
VGYLAVLFRRLLHMNNPPANKLTAADDGLFGTTEVQDTGSIYFSG